MTFFFKAIVCSLVQGDVSHGSRGEGITEEDVGTSKEMATGLRGFVYSPGGQELPILLIRISQ